MKFTISDSVTGETHSIEQDIDEDWEKGDGCPNCGNNALTIVQLTGEVGSKSHGLVSAGGSHGPLEVSCQECDTTLYQHPAIAAFDALSDEHWRGMPNESEAIHISFENDDSASFDFQHADGWMPNDTCPVCSETMTYDIHLDTMTGAFDSVTGAFIENTPGERLATLGHQCDVCDEHLFRNPLIDFAYSYPIDINE